MMQQTIDSVERGLLGLKKAGLEEILFIHLQGLIPVSAEKTSLGKQPLGLTSANTSLMSLKLL